MSQRVEAYSREKTVSSVHFLAAILATVVCPAVVAFSTIERAKIPRVSARSVSRKRSTIRFQRFSQARPHGSRFSRSRMRALMSTTTMMNRRKRKWHQKVLMSQRRPLSCHLVRLIVRPSRQIASMVFEARSLVSQSWAMLPFSSISDFTSMQNH